MSYLINIYDKIQPSVIIYEYFVNDGYSISKAVRHYIAVEENNKDSVLFTEKLSQATKFITLNEPLKIIKNLFSKYLINNKENPNYIFNPDNYQNESFISMEQELDFTKQLTFKYNISSSRTLEISLTNFNYASTIKYPHLNRF